MLSTWFRRRRVKRRQPSHNDRQRQTIHEYRNFFTYHGENQDRSPVANGEMLPDSRVKVSAARTN